VEDLTITVPSKRVLMLSAAQRSTHVLPELHAALGKTIRTSIGIAPVLLEAGATSV
jgi:hypothetical protein